MTSFDQSQAFWTSTEASSVDADQDADENGISMLTDGTFCSVKWDDLWSKYNPDVHYPLLLFICIVGCVTNVLNLFIFTRSTMRNPTNLLLSVLAVTDFFCVFRKAVGVFIAFYRQGFDQRTSYQRKLFHTWSIYMTVVVALWRLLGILRPMQSRYWLSYKSATLVAGIFLGFATLLVPLSFVGTSLELYNSGPQYNDYQSNRSTNTNESSPDDFESNDDDPDYVLTQTNFGEMLQFWIHGILIKLGPCFVLMVTTILLITSLRAATKNRLALFEDQDCLKTAPADIRISKKLNAKNPDRTRNNDSQEAGIRDSTKQSNSAAATKEFIKTTKMLIILLILFVVTELPPGILAFCFGLIQSKKFFLQCYIPIRPFLNLNEYISSSVGFFIYFKMSSKFRQTFIQQFGIGNRTNDANSTFFRIFSSIVRTLSSKDEEERMTVSNENKNPAAKLVDQANPNPSLVTFSLQQHKERLNAV